MAEIVDFRKFKKLHDEFSGAAAAPADPQARKARFTAAEEVKIEKLRAEFFPDELFAAVRTERADHLEAISFHVLDSKHSPFLTYAKRDMPGKPGTYDIWHRGPGGVSIHVEDIYNFDTFCRYLETCFKSARSELDMLLDLDGLPDLPTARDLYRDGQLDHFIQMVIERRTQAKITENSQPKTPALVLVQ